MEHSRLLKFLVPGRDKANTMSSEESPTFKIQYEYQNPTDVEAEVPSSQNIRESDPKILETSNEDITDGAVSEFRNGGYTVTKRTYTEHKEIVQGSGVIHTTVSLSTGTKNEKENQPDDIEYRRPKTKIPKLKFRQAAERVRDERRKSKETMEHTSQIPTPRTSIPRLSRVSKIPPPTTKPIVTKREVKQTIVTSKPDDEFDKIYEEIIEHTDVTGDLTDPEKIDSEFEEIIHAYDESKVQTPTPKVRQSKIPSLRRKSDHEIEAQKSSTKFTEKSKIRSIPRLKEISMRAKEDNNDVSQVVRHYTKTVRTEKISGKDDLENKKRTDDIDRKSLVRTIEYNKTFKIGEVDLSDQNLRRLDDETENAKITKTSQLTRIMKSEKSYDNDKLSMEEINIIDKPDFIYDTGNKTITKITKSIRTISNDTDNENNKELTGENRKQISDVESKKLTKTTEVKKTIKIEKLSDTDDLDEEIETDINLADNRNIIKTRQLTKVVRSDTVSQESGASNIIQEDQVNTINRSVSMEHKQNIRMLKTENFEKNSVKVGIPVFNKQVSENSIEMNTQILYPNKNIETQISDGNNIGLEKEISNRSKIFFATATENKAIEVKSDKSPTHKDTYTVTRVSSNLNSNNNDKQIETKHTKYSINDKELGVSERKFHQIKSDSPTEITKTVTITRLISSPVEKSNVVQHKMETEDITTMKIEKDIEILKPSTLQFDTISSKESSSTYTIHSEKDKNTISTTTKIEKDNTDDELLELKGKVGRLINKMDTKALTLADIPRKDLDEELPKKKSVLSKIAMFERQDINEPMTKKKLRPEKLYIKQNPQEKTVHIHTPQIVDEVLKPVQTSEIKDLEAENVSPQDPFLTYKPLYEHYKNMEITKSTESLDSKGETIKFLEVKSPNLQRPLSPLRMTDDMNSLNNKYDNPIMVDAPVILISPKTNYKKNINLNTNENTAEFAKTTLSVKETQNIEVLKPVQINVDSEASKIEVESSKPSKTSSDTEITAFKDVKKNIAMYENYGNLSKTVDKEKHTIFKDYTVDTKSDKDSANYEIKVKNDSTKHIKEIITTKEDIKFENVKPINNILTQKVITYENIMPTNEIVKTKEELKYDVITPVKQTMTTKEEMVYEKIEPTYRMATNEEIKYEKSRPVSEILTTKTEFQYGNVQLINRELTIKDENKHEKKRPVSEIITTKTEVLYDNVPSIDHKLRLKNESRDEKVRPISEIVATKTEFQYNVRPISQLLNIRDENKYEKARSTSELSGSTRHWNDEQTHKNWFVNKSISSSYNSELDRTEVLTNETYRLDGKYGRYESRDVDDDIRRFKSIVELDLGDAVKGKVNSTILRMKSVEIFNTDKKEVINIKEMPKMMSVWEKIALFEGKATAARSDSVSISSRVKSTKTRPAIQMTEEEYQQKLEELHSAKKRYGKREQMPSVVLSNGAKMPVLAVGTALIDTRLTSQVVSTAIELGYRAIDCAYIYGNEKEIGDAVREKITDGTVKREDLFIISKLWSTFHRRDLVEKACRASLDAMGLDYFDLYLIHNPMSFKEGDDPIPKIATVLQYSQHDYLSAWYGMEDLVSKGLVKNIGVSNFNSVQIQRILGKGKIKPVVNQVECHPYLSQQRLHTFCAERNITLSCYGVLGSKGTPVEYKNGQSPVIDDPLVQVMASGLDKTPAQLLIRYQIDCEHNVVVKTTSGFRLWDNLKALDFTLTPGQIDALHALNRNKRNFAFSGMGDTHKNYPFKIAF